MSAVGPKLSSAREEIVDVTRDANGDATEAARECPAIGGFDDQMDVISLHGVVDDAKALRIATCGTHQGEADGGKDELAA